MAGSERQAIELLVKMLGAQAVESGMKRVSSSVERTGKDAEKTGGLTNRMGEAFASAGQSIVRFIAGFAGMYAIVNTMRQLAEHSEKVRKELEALGDQATQTQEQVLKLADQMGDTSQRGLTKAMTKAADVTRAGALPSIETGATILQSVMSNIEADPGVQMQMAKDIARLAGRSGVDVEAAGVLPEFAQAAGMAGTPEQMQGFLAKMDAALKASASLGAGPFGVGTIKGGIGMLAQGASVDDVLSLMVMARATGGASDEQAAQNLKRVAQATARPEVRKFIEQRSGTGFQGMGWAERMDVLRVASERAETDLKERTALEQILQPREMMLFPTVFSAAGREGYRRGRAAVSGADWAKVLESSQAFAESNLGISRRLRATAQQRVATMPTEQYAEVELGRLAEQAITEIPTGYFEQLGLFGRANQIDYVKEQLRGALPGMPGQPVPSNQYRSPVDRALGAIGLTGTQRSAADFTKRVFTLGMAGGSSGGGSTTIVNNNQTVYADTRSVTQPSADRPEVEVP